MPVHMAAFSSDGAGARLGALTELSRTQLLLQLADLPDLALEAEGFAALSPVLQHVARVIQEALAVDTVGIALYEPETTHLLPAGSAGLAEGVIRAGEPALARVVTDGQPLRVEAGMSQAPGAAGTDGSNGRQATQNGDDTLRALLGRLAATTLAAVPIAVDGEPRGVLYAADRRSDAFDDERFAFLALVASRVGLLLERAEVTRARHEIERQRAQAAARQELLGIVTHELKTPVAVLKAYTELLLGRAEAAGRDEEVELLRRMEDQEERLLGLIEQVLDLQRLDAGFFPLEIARVDLPGLATRVLEGLQLTAGSVRLRVQVDDQVTIRADRRRIEQVLTNLVQNAVRFSPPGEEVLVRVRSAERLPPPLASASTIESQMEPSGWALVSVSDRGPGVAEADRHRIFGRFYQGKGGDRPHRGHGGLGVGLYIAREIVLRHGGDLWLEATAPERPGATFTFALPVAGPPLQD